MILKTPKGLFLLSISLPRKAKLNKLFARTLTMEDKEVNFYLAVQRVADLKYCIFFSSGQKEVLYIDYKYSFGKSLVIHEKKTETNVYIYKCVSL